MRVIFTEIILPEDQQEKLVDWWISTFGANMLPKQHAHHLTIKFRPSEEEVAATPFGKRIALNVLGFASDARCQAIVVEPVGLESANPIPHITLFTATGVRPVYSNELLGRGWTPFDFGNPCDPLDNRQKGIALHGIVGYFNGSEHLTE